MSRIHFLSIVLTFITSTVLCQQTKTQVAIISTIHGAHKVNANYTYDSLFAFIKKFDPAIIGVEIRADDIDSSVNYLQSNYPYEMYACKTQFPTIRVVGFDWLGKDLEGKAIPVNYWKESSAIRQTQQKLNADSVIVQKLSLLNVLKEEKNKIALQASLSGMNDGRYDLVNKIYYNQLAQLLKGTAYESLTEFYRQRDEYIAGNIIRIIRQNPGKKLIFLVGADHRYYTLDAVKEAVGGEIELLND